jgi:hypothetical protein
MQVTVQRIKHIRKPGKEPALSGYDHYLEHNSALNDIF